MLTSTNGCLNFIVSTGLILLFKKILKKEIIENKYSRGKGDSKICTPEEKEDKEEHWGIRAIIEETQTLLITLDWQAKSESSNQWITSSIIGLVEPIIGTISRLDDLVFDGSLDMWPKCYWVFQNVICNENSCDVIHCMIIGHNYLFSFL